MNNAKTDLRGVSGQVEFCEDAYEAANQAHAIVLLTDWREYRGLDFQRIYGGMERPAFVFDGRNFLDHELLYRMGFNVIPIGKPERTRL
jgi:UDPglucose 6-dehydrogenase